jgi:pimeloyl-ACP methyl ester carboxylesterase
VTFRAILLALAAAIAAPAVAQESPARAPAQQGSAQFGLVQSYGKHPSQFGELRLPPGKGPWPVAVVIHGGCVGLSGTAPLAEALAAQGIASWNIEYRSDGGPAILQDVAAALDHLATLAGMYPLDLKRVAAIGHSSGASLALWAVSRHQLQGSLGTPRVQLATVVALDGPGQLTPITCGTPASLAGTGGTAAETPRLPLGIHQALVLADFAPAMTAYADAATAAGDTVVKMAPGGADHLNITIPTTPQGKEVLAFILREAFGR